MHQKLHLPCVLQAGAFTNMLNLKDLRLDHNVISYFDPAAFFLQGSPLGSLDISHNLLASTYHSNNSIGIWCYTIYILVTPQASSASLF